MKEKLGTAVSMFLILLSIVAVLTFLAAVLLQPKGQDTHSFDYQMRTVETVPIPISNLSLVTSNETMRVEYCLSGYLGQNCTHLKLVVNRWSGFYKSQSVVLYELAGPAQRQYLSDFNVNWNQMALSKAQNLRNGMHEILGMRCQLYIEPQIFKDVLVVTSVKP